MKFELCCALINFKMSSFEYFFYILYILNDNAILKQYYFFPGKSIQETLYWQ